MGIFGYVAQIGECYTHLRLNIDCIYHTSLRCGTAWCPRQAGTGKYRQNARNDQLKDSIAYNGVLSMSTLLIALHIFRSRPLCILHNARPTQTYHNVSILACRRTSDRGNLYLAKRENNVHQFGQHSQKCPLSMTNLCLDTICCNGPAKRQFAFTFFIP